MKKFIPKDATIAITYKCNSRCQMCNIWQVQHPSELPLSYFRNLNKELKYINLTGGEPFLRTDLPEIVAIIKKAAPKAQIIFSSNGLATELIVETMKKIKAIHNNFGVRISLDGIGDVHDRVRGIPGIYGHVLETVKQLKAIGVTNLGFSFTLQENNHEDLIKVYELSRQIGVELAMALVQNSDIYFGKDTNRIQSVKPAADALDYVINAELKSSRPKQWLRAYYDYGLKLYLTKGERLLPSGAGIDSLFIDPSGKIYPSNLISLEMGNLGADNLAETWNGMQANGVRKEISEKGITESWIICTIRGEMKKHAFRVIWWTFINKIRVILKK